MIKRQNKLTATLRKTLVLFLVGILFFTGAVSTGALEWNGDSSTGSSTGRPVEDNSFWVSSSALSDLSNIVVAWRFTFYDKDGRKPYYDTANGSGGDGVQYVEIWLPNTSEDFWDSSNYYWISSVVNTSAGNIKYSKLDFARAAAAGKIAPGPLKLVDRSYSAARKGCWLFGSTNWFDQFGGFSYEIPASSSAIGAWCTDPKNSNTLALALGCKGGTAGMRPGDVIVVEPVFWQQANGERVAATASEFASMGALYAGLDSDGLVYSVEGTTDGTWGATCRYTNLKYPTYLYTPDGMGLWNNAVLKSGASDFDKLYTMREIMTGGYGVGIAFGIPKAVSYTLTVNPNGGSWNGTTGNSSFTIDSGSTKTIANPTRTGYTFAGWTVSGGGSMSGTTYTQGDGDCTLTAQWTVNSYTQVNNFYKYDPYNGTWSYYTSKSTSAAYGSTFYCTTDGIATPTGYYWSHFNRNSWTVTGDKNDGDGNGHFYPIQYTVTYDANGGSGAPAAQNFYMNGIGLSGTAYYSSTVPTRTGYTFAGWVCRENGISVSAGEAIPNGWGGHTLVAQWTVNTYTNYINHYKWNPNTSKWDYQKQTTVAGTYGSAVTIPSNHVQSYTGYYNTGNTGSYWGTSTWSGKAIGGTFTQPAGSVTMEYYYQPNTYTQTTHYCRYDPYSGSWVIFQTKNENAAYSTTYTSSTSGVTTPTGHYFAGYLNDGGTSTVSWTVTGATTIYAHYYANTYTVTYDANGGSGAPAAQNFYMNGIGLSGTAYYSSTVPTRTGYTFAGWYYPGTGQYLSAGQAIPNGWGGHTLVAQWTVNSYTQVNNFYKYDPYNSTWSYYTSKSTSATYGSTFYCTTDGIATPTGYYWGGFNKNSWTVTGEKNDGDGNGHFYPIQYTVTYDANGGSGAPAAQNFYMNGIGLSGTAYYSSTVPTRTGYTFAGWVCRENGISVSAGEAIPNGWESHTLVAQWTVNTYYLDLNGYLDGTVTGNLSGFGTADVYINGTLVADDVEDFYAEYPYGTTYEIKDIKTQTGKQYNGVYSGSLSGTITYTTSVFLDFSTTVYSLTVNPNGGSWNSTTSNSSFTLAYGSTKTIANPTRTGYTFAGWTVSGGGSISGTTYTQGDGDCTLTAQWTANTYTNNIYHYKWDPYSSTWALQGTTTFTGTFGSSVTIPTSHIQSYVGFGNTGNAGSNWGTNTWSSKAIGGTFTQPAGGVGYIEYLYYPIQYTVTYDANGGSGAPAAQNFYMNGIGLSGTAYYSSTVPTRTGYTFAGWYYPGTGQYLSAGQAIPNGWGGHTLVAQWTVNSYTLTVNPNGGSWNSTTSNSSFTLAYGSTKTIANPTRTGYTFAGWTVSGGGSVSGTTYTQGDGDCTLTAQWTANTYTNNIYHYKWDPYLSTWAFQRTTTFAGTFGSSVTIPTSHIQSYVGFGNTGTAWSYWGTSTWSSKAIGGAFTQPAGGVGMEYYYYPTTYTVTYDANGGSGAPAAQNFYMNGIGLSGTAYYSSTVPTRTGYTFAGWVCRENGVSVSAGEAISNGWESHTLVAQWTANTYTITLDKQSGTGGTSTVYELYASKFYIDTTNKTAVTYITVPARTGYTFGGYYTSTNGGGTQVIDASGNIKVENTFFSSNATIYAKWTVNTYYLDLNGYLDGTVTGSLSGFGTADVYINGILVADDVEDFYTEYPYGTTYEIKDIKTQTGKQYNGVYSGSLAGTITNTTGVFLDFSTIVYTVAYDANGGSGAPGRQEKYHGVDITLSILKPTKVGYVFLGWNTKADGSGTSYAPGDSYTANASVTLYAQWKAAVEVSIITPNAAYGAGTEVITSVLVNNDTGLDILPGDGVKVSFTVTKSTGTIATLSKSEVVIPAGESNMVWFKWTVPASVPSSLHLTCTVSDAGGNVLDSDEKSWHTGKAENYQTPDTVFEAAAPQYWVMPSVPVTNNPSASWWEWVYENGAFEKKEYQAHLETEAFTITPDPDILSNYWNGSVWTMRSGYGIRMDWKTRLVSTGSSDADAGMVTAAQTAYALFPEFGYAQADGSCRLLDRLSGSFVFPVNPASDDNDRLHYTPLWFPDGAQIYRVAGIAYDCWTPAGMISIVDASGGISIDGSIYDDWYIGRFPR